MKINIRTFCRQMAPWALSFLSSVALYLSVARVEIGVVLDAPDPKLLLKTFSTQGGNAVFLFFFLLLGFVLRSPYVKWRKSDIAFGAIFGLVFSFLNTAGAYFSQFGSFGGLLHGKMGAVHCVLFLTEWLGLSVCFGLVGIALAKISLGFRPKTATPASARRVFWWSLVVLLAIWGVFFACYGAPMSPDTWLQIKQGLGVVPLGDHHPFLLTLLIGSVVSLGRWMWGSVQAGVNLFSCLQLFLLAIVVSYAMSLLARWRVSPRWMAAAFAFYALHPFVGFYSFAPLKDVWIAGALLLYLLFLMRTFFEPDAWRLSPRRFLALFLIFLLIFFAKKTGFAVVAFSLPFVMFLFRSHKYRFVGAFLCALLVLLVVRGPIFEAYGIKKGGEQEMLSRPLQQMAHTVKAHNGHLDEEDKAQIAEILPFEELPALYDCRVSDRVKGRLNNAVFSRDPLRYMTLWGRLSVRYPLDALDAGVAGTLGYWYPNVLYGTLMHATLAEVIVEQETAVVETGGLPPLCEPFHEPLLMSRLFQIMYLVKTIPVISLLFSVGFYFWILLACVFLLCYRRRYAALLPFAILLAEWGTCLISPIFAELRYALPAVFAVPIMLVFTSIWVSGKCAEDADNPPSSQ